MQVAHTQDFGLTHTHTHRQKIWNNNQYEIYVYFHIVSYISVNSNNS